MTKHIFDVELMSTATIRVTMDDVDITKHKNETWEEVAEEYAREAFDDGHGSRVCVEMDGDTEITAVREIPSTKGKEATQ